MFPLLIFIVAGLVGYYFSAVWLIVIAIIFLVVILILFPHTRGELESLAPVAITVLLVISLVGGLLGYFISEPPKWIEKVPPILKQEKKNGNSTSNLAETLKQLEEAGIITINKKGE